MVTKAVCVVIVNVCASLFIWITLGLVFSSSLHFIYIFLASAKGPFCWLQMCVFITSFARPLAFILVTFQRLPLMYWMDRSLVCQSAKIQKVTAKYLGATASKMLWFILTSYCKIKPEHQSYIITELKNLILYLFLYKCVIEIIPVHYLLYLSTVISFHTCANI